MAVPIWLIGALCAAVMILLVAVVVLVVSLLRLRPTTDLQWLQQQVTDMNRRLEEWQKTGATQQQVSEVQNKLVAANQSLIQLRTVLDSLSNFTQQTLHREASERLHQAIANLSQLQEALRSVEQSLNEHKEGTMHRHSELQNALSNAQAALKGLQESLQSIFEQLQRVFDFVKDMPTFAQTLNSVAGQVSDITAVLLGRASGRAAELLVDELLSVFPEGWVQRDVNLKQGVVEFAIALPGGYLVPLDSKFVGADLVRQLQEAQDDEVKRRLGGQLNKDAQRRAKELAKYLTDPRCIGFGIAAVPDPVYAFCRRIKDIAQNQVVLVPYSLLVPFVLSLYLLAQRLGISARVGEAEQVIGTVTNLVQQAQKELENMAKEISSISNQHSRALTNIQQALIHLQGLAGREVALPPLGQQPTLPTGEEIGEA